MSYVPERGDIVHLQFDPASGKEMLGPHYGLVISSKLFNQHGLAFICPISQGSGAGFRTYGTVVTLMGSGTGTQGDIFCHQMKSLDWQKRHAVFKERVPDFVFLEVSARLDAILNG